MPCGAMPPLKVLNVRSKAKGEYGAGASVRTAFEGKGPVINGDQPNAKPGRAFHPCQLPVASTPSPITGKP